MIRLAQISRGLALYVTDDHGTRLLVVQSAMPPRPDGFVTVEELTVDDVRELRRVCTEWLEEQPDELERERRRRLVPSPEALP
jgi:hypothetical protein